MRKHRPVAFALREAAAHLPQGEARPERKQYTDLAVMPVTDDEVETRELFQSDAAHAYVRQEQRLDKVSHGAAA